MLYLTSLNILNTKHILLFISILFLVAALICIIRNVNGVTNFVGGFNTKLKMLSVTFSVFLIVILSIIMLLSVSQQMYYRNSYLSQDYNIVEGEVQQFEYIYANNSKNIIGIRFLIGCKGFEVNNGVLNGGYSIYDNIINSNGQKLRIYYNDNDVILRIDELV